MKKVNLICDPEVNVIVLKNGYKELRILKNNQDDLLFCLSHFQDDSTFTIDETNTQIYEAVNELYCDFIESRIFKGMDEWELERIKSECVLFNEDYEQTIVKLIEENQRQNQNFKKSIYYRSLVKDGIVSWLSDTEPDHIASSFVIEKLDHAYRFTFYSSPLKEESKNIVVTIARSGSKYLGYSNCLFRFYESLEQLGEQNRTNNASWLNSLGNKAKNMMRILTKK